MPFLGLDHVDLRVPSLAAVEPFYDALLTRLGLTKKAHSFVDVHGDWHDANDDDYNCTEWAEEDAGERPPIFFGVIEDASMTVSQTRVAFAAASRAEVERWSRELPGLGARDVELWDHEGRYVAVFFTDPLGTRLEIVARTPRL